MTAEFPHDPPPPRIPPITCPEPAPEHRPPKMWNEEMSALLVNLNNDLLTYRREALNQNDGFNLLAAIRRQHDCGEEQGLATATSICTRISQRFFALADTVRADLDDPEVHRYIDALVQYFAGVTAWSVRDSVRFR